MKIDLWNGHSAYLLNFSPDERNNYPLAVKELFRLTAGRHGFPTMRSREIYVFRNSFDSAPRYLDQPCAEFISLTVSENKPLQFAYQFAHEASHLLAQNWQRFQKPGYHPWIEEALCGAHSILCLRELSKHAGWWATEGAKFLTDYIDKSYPISAIDSNWYQINQGHLSSASGLTDIIKPLSRLIADEFPDGQFAADNMALIPTPPNQDLQDYLQAWEARCPAGATVPALFLSLFGIV
ncbi:hypothetical protein [Bradyrhizobium japonicum]|uniref:hypothetical protein n=1 Tax=Bradyrhizobium japonicum TaxID=375 RepID=UPI00209E2F81|nr:hypothetical protein [Bradyrhizobium japonicum]MCP1760994.1 hypothetical protein [Bradyrhizobium japonicum]MCP1792573.1 hypothetical protein [Bradyrhizobium japonicum]MCP1805008.1 hypothetical protein [Bradyrhizobium japonicum]MCP1814029.1 hypothetical protein [Bradyrhizobium japonicum]MCP1874549.1 hypothetical protein [Bradyrhizobium japonicum]